MVRAEALKLPPFLLPELPPDWAAPQVHITSHTGGADGVAVWVSAGSGEFAATIRIASGAVLPIGTDRATVQGHEGIVTTSGPDTTLSWMQSATVAVSITVHGFPAEAVFELANTLVGPSAAEWAIAIDGADVVPAADWATILTKDW